MGERAVKALWTHWTSPRFRVARAVLVRLGTSVLVLWGAVTVAFVALHLTPGSVEQALVGPNTITPQARAELVAEYGLDEPLLVQYGRLVGRMARGDLGQSYQLHEPVADALGSQLGPSLQLAGAAMALAVVASLTLALLTAGRGRWIRGLSSGIELVGVSIPTFWTAIVLLTVFSFQRGWFPAAGADGGAALVLPAVAVAVPLTALLTQLLRDSLELALDEPFVLTARARGLSDLAVRMRHALRHALLPALTLAGWMFGALVGALVVVEEIFARPGLGRLVLTAVEGKDLPVVMGAVLVTAVLYVAVNIVLDLLYLVVDPRLRGAR
ncbi:MULTISPECIES: ABC transporter permease [Actinomadura]|uniref:ABC transporter permease n=1 Tax=Actinomadura TaxID=1988 RepID=UPI0031EDDB10